MEGKIAWCNYIFEIINSNIIEQSQKATAVGLESKHPAIFTSTRGSQDSVDSDICTHVIKDFSRPYLVFDPITCSRLLYKHLHTPGELRKTFTLKPVARRPVNNLHFPAEPFTKTKQQLEYLSYIEISWPWPRFTI